VAINTTIVLTADRFADAGQVVPAMTPCVVLDHKLRGDRRAETQREGYCLAQLLIYKFQSCLRDFCVQASTASISSTVRKLGIDRPQPQQS